MVSRFFGPSKRSFEDLSEQEVLALAISSEEDDARIYLAYAEGLRDQYPQSSKVFEDMAEEEHGHRNRLIALHQKRFGETIPLIRREHVRGYFERKPDWLIRPLGIEKVRDTAEQMERSAQRYYIEAAQRSKDASTRKLLGDLAIAEQSHVSLAKRLGLKHVNEDAKADEAETERRQFILTYVQPGLAGLMDGSVSTLAPIFATAFATQNTWTTFLVGLSASVGAGISMGFTEAAHDDGKISGRYWRAWPCVALFDPALLDGDIHCSGGSGHRAVCDHLDSEQIHGNAMAPRSNPSAARRRAGVCGGCADRQCVISLQCRASGCNRLHAEG
jgi:erythrin-vacuolar iron transport family protein